MKKEQRVKRTKNREWMNLLCTEKQKMNSNTVLLFAFLLNVFFTHTLFICVALERYSTKNILPLHTIYIANRFSFCNKHTNSIVTILIVDLLTLGIIRTVDIFTPKTGLSSSWREMKLMTWSGLCFITRIKTLKILRLDICLYFFTSMWI
jgi:hypothetical protein